MKYIAAIFVLWSVLYIISFAKYNLDNKNKSASVGAITLAFLIVAIPIVVMFMK